MKFSIIIPIYKVEKYLHECVDSVLSQSFTDYEIILVDDGSPDDCPRICDEYAQKDKRIKVVHQANAGLACARNAGIEVASGEWLICIDSDDYFANNDVFQHVADKAEEGVDVVLYGFRKLYESNGRFGEDVVPVFDGVLNTSTMLNTVLRSDTYCGTAWTKAVRLGVLQEYGIVFRPGMISEDIDWYLHLMCKAKTYASTNEAAIIYRQRPGSISHAAKLNSLTDNLWILEYWPGKIKELVEDEDKVKALYHVLAYYYDNDMILFSGYSKEVSEPYRERLKKVSSLLNYAVTPRALTVRRFYKFFGFDLTVKALRLLGKLKTRK